MPRELWAISGQEMEIREYKVGEPKEEEVKIFTEYGVSKHGTEMSLVQGYGKKRGRFDSDIRIFMPEGVSDEKEQNLGQTASSGFGELPARVGNMFVGVVASIGSEVKHLAEGDRVLGYGPFREVQLAKENKCWKMPEGLSWKSAVCLDPAQFAMSAVRDGQVRIGDSIAVFGLGAIGLMAIQFAKLSGAELVIAVDPLANRRQAAKLSGADLEFDPNDCDVGIKIKEATSRRGVDVAIEYSGSVNAMQQALRSVAFGGNVVSGAFPPPYGPGLDLGAEAHFNIPNIIFSRGNSDPNRDHPRWNFGRVISTCWKYFLEGKLSGDHIVSPIVQFDDLVTEYPKIANDPSSNIKLAADFHLKAGY